MTQASHPPHASFLPSPPSLCTQDFLNGVCTNIIWLTHQKLNYYTGNYDTFIKTVAENEVGRRFTPHSPFTPPSKCASTLSARGHSHLLTLSHPQVVQMKKYQKEQDDIKHLKEFIASCGTYANLVKQV